MTPSDALAALAAIGRTTLALALAAVVVQVVLRLTRPQSPRVHRAAWSCVLAVGWLFFRVPVVIPYYESAEPAAEMAMEAAAPSDAAPRWGAVSRPHPLAERRSPEAGEDAGDHPSVVPSGSETRAESSRGVGQAERSPAKSRGKAWWDCAPLVPPYVLGLWLAGMMALVLIWLAGYAWFVWRLPTAIDGPAEWQQQWDQLLAEHGIHRPIPLHVTARSGPMLCRLPRGYRLLVPVELWNRLEPAARLSVLRHELEHFRRGDVWKSLLVRLAALPHWFNPAAWWAVARLDEAAEWACDAAACGACPTAAADYAKSLLALDELAGRHALLRPAAWGRGLSQRIRRLTAGQPLEDTVMKRIIVVGMAWCLVAALGVRFEWVARSKAAADQEKTTAATLIETSRPAQGAAKTEAKATFVASPRGILLTQVSKKTVTPGSVPRQNLRYDGKSFDEWYRESKTELKTERRTEAIRAFTEFGRHGYGKEATQAILEVMRDYSAREIRNNPEGKLKSAAFNAFSRRDDTGEELRPIDPNQSVPVLVRELKEGNENSRFFALAALRDIGPDAKAAIPALLEVWQSSNAETSGRWTAISGLVNADPSGEHVVPLLRKTLAAEDVARFKQLLNVLAPPSHSRTNALVEIDPASAESINATAELARLAGTNVRSQEPKLRLTALGRAVLPVLVEAVGHKTPEVRQAAIMTVGRCKAAATSALPDLLRAFEKGNTQDRIAVAAALADWAPDAASAAPVLIRRLERASDFWEKAAIARTLGKMGAAAKDALPSIEKTMSDFLDAYRNGSLPSSQVHALWPRFNEAGESIGRETPGGWRSPRMPLLRGATRVQPPGPQSPPPSVPKPTAKEPKPAKPDAPKSK